jgi:hypothetical protein
MDETTRIDLLGGVVAGIGDATFKSNGDRNVLQGGNSLFGGAQIGQKMETFQWTFKGVYRRNFEKEVDAGAADDVKFKANSELLLRADVLNKLSDVSFLHTHLETEFESEVSGKDSGVGELFAPTTTYEIGTEYQQMISKDLLARVGVDYTIESSYTGQYNSDRAWTFGIGANYQF